MKVCTLDASTGTPTVLASNLPVYDEPSAIYHGCWKRGLHSETNGWSLTHSFYSDGGVHDDNDHMRKVYSELVVASHHQRFSRFGEFSDFLKVAGFYENTITRLGTSNHPLVAYTYLQYINFINQHSISKKTDELAPHIGNIILYLNLHWTEKAGGADDAFTFIEVESYKVLSMFYAARANYLYRKAVSTKDENEKEKHFRARCKFLLLADENVKMALGRCKDDKQKEILQQKHEKPIAEQKERTDEVKDFSFKTVAYVGAVEAYIDGRSCKNLLGRLESLLTSQAYLPIAITDTAWFEPLVLRSQKTQQHFSQQQVVQQAVLEQLDSQQFCMCHDCHMMRVQILWYCQNIPSEFTCADQLHFEVSRFADMVRYFHRHFEYIDNLGKNFILDIIGRLTINYGYLSLSENDLFQSMEARIKASFGSSI